MIRKTHITAIATLILSMPLAGIDSSAQDEILLGVSFWRNENTELFDLDDLVHKFAKIEEISLKQAWLPELEPDFNPTGVKVAWRPEGLYVFARLQDKNIGSRSTDYNQRLWELGDAFESFFRFKGADVYYEFHVSPNNHVMQLCFDVDLTPAQRQRQLPELFMPKQVVESKVWVEETKSQWYVLLMIPSSAITPSGTFTTGDMLEFSFSRYDSNHAGKEPLLSSSSDHKELNFHCREDWGTLILESPE